MDRQLSAVLLASLMLLAPVAIAFPATASSGVGGPSGHVGVPSENVGPPDHAQANHGPGGGGPPGLQRASADVPTEAQDWQVSASDHAGDLVVEVGADANGKLAIGLTDDVNHESRQVAIDASTLVETVGERPQIAHGLHEDGDEWRSPIQYRDGFAIIEVPRFSSNTITFDGTFAINATPAQDGDTFSYNSSNGGENLDINVTGSTAEEWDNESATGVSPSSNQSISVGGNLDPTGPSSNNEPELIVSNEGFVYNPLKDEGSGSQTSKRKIAGDSGSSDPVEAEAKIVPNEGGDITEIRPEIVELYGSDYGTTVDVFIVNGEDPDTVYGEGTKVATWDPDWTKGQQTITLDSPYSVTAGTNYTVEFITNTTDGDGNPDFIRVGLGDSIGENWYTQGGVNLDRYPEIDMSTGPIEGLSVSDGAGNSQTIGTLNESETTTTEYGNLSTSSTELNWSGTGSSPLGWTLEMQERTQTVDPTVDVNGGNTTSHTGTLADGETVSLSANDSWIVNGTNNVTVTVGDGTLSADAPTSEAGLDYSHDISESKSVDYEAEAFSERYAVSKIWQEDTDDATLSIPWASDRVIGVRRVEVEYYDENGDFQSSTTSPTYSVDNGTLIVELGDVPAGWETRVDADGSKVQVENGEIMVITPTIEGDDLDSEIEITNKTAGFGIDVSGLDDRVHYLAESSWTGTPYSEHTSTGDQVIRMPDASEGSTTRIRTLQMDVNPTGEIETIVEDPDKPRFRLRAGSTAGSDDVEIVYHDTFSGTTYKLHDVTNDREIMRDTAESPVYLLTSGDSLTYVIEAVDDSTGATVAVTSDSGSGSPLSILALFLGMAGSILGTVFAGRRWLGFRGVRSNGLLLVVGGVVGVVGAELATPRSLLSDLLFVSGGAFGDAISAFATSGAGAVIVGLSILLGIFLLDRRTRIPVPMWFYIIGGGVTLIWILDALADGGLTDSLTELGPLLWLLVIGGGLVLLWRALQPTIVNIGGDR